MMTEKQVITMPQLFCMLFISRMVVDITYTPYLAGGGEVWDHVLSAAISWILTFIMVLPVYFLYRRQPSMTLADQAYFLMGKAGYAVSAVYALYFLIMSCYTLSMFEVFVTNAMSPQISLPMLTLAILATSCYGAFKGIEALARTSGFILVVLCASIIFLICALFPQVDTVNYPPFMLNGPQQTIGGVLLMLSRTACIPAMAMLLPLAKGSAKSGIFVWNTSVHLLTGILLTLMVGALGEFLQTQLFPVYAAASVAEIGVFKRMDALYLGIWTAGLFLKTALFLVLFSMCVRRIWGERAGRVSIGVGGVLIGLFSLLVAHNRFAAAFLFDLNFLLWCTVTTSILLPLLLLVVSGIRKKHRRSHAQT